MNRPLRLGRQLVARSNGDPVAAAVRAEELGLGAGHTPAEYDATGIGRSAHNLTRCPVRRSRKALADGQRLRTRERTTARHIADELTVPVPTARAALRRAGIRRAEP